MKEYLIEAIVLSISPLNEDRLVRLYSKEFGYLSAHLISGRKILSKLAPHLDPLNLVLIRLVEKKQFIIADALVLDRFEFLRKSKKIKFALDILYLLNSLAPPLTPDLKLWYRLIQDFKKNSPNLKEILKILGYDPQKASCQICQNSEINYFYLPDQSFLCYSCHPKFPEIQLLYIKREL